MKKTEHSRVGNYNVQVPKIGRGTVATEFLAQLISAIPKVLQGGRGVNVEYFGGKYIISSTGGGRGGGGSVFDATVTDIGNDAVEATISDATYVIAKPYTLRKTPFDGIEITYPNGPAITYTYDVTNPQWKRVADNGTYQETQVITPNYFVGETIQVVPYGGGAPYIDINTAGRMWARISS